jgi:O-antigen/teichoic acid export membrane protein
MSTEARAGSFGRSAGGLSAGVGAAGLLTYVFFSLASHNLDATSYGEIVVLWSAVFLTISVLHRPVEQFISRGVAEQQAHGEPIGATLATATKLQGAVAVAFAVAALALRGPLEDLFSGDETLYWIYVAAVLCFAASFFARGFLAGSGRFGLLAGLLVCESASRTAFALALALGIASGQDAVALGVVAAPVFSLVVVPFAFARHAAAAESPPAQGDAPRASLARGGAFAGAVFVVMCSEQALLNGGPLLVRGFEGAAEAGFIFNVLMLARAPLLVFQGVAISLLPHLTRLRSRGGGEADAAFALSIDQTLRAIAVFAVAVGAIVAAAGPELMELAFGDRFTYDRAGLLIVTVAMGLYLAATTLNQAALARGQARAAAIAWGACAAGFLLWSVLPMIDDPARRIEIGFALAAGALLAALWRLHRSPRSPDERGIATGSVEETEARLALADEAS